jgi:hypothetical protein
MGLDHPGPCPDCGETMRASTADGVSAHCPSCGADWATGDEPLAFVQLSRSGAHDRRIAERRFSEVCRVLRAIPAGERVSVRYLQSAEVRGEVKAFNGSLVQIATDEIRSHWIGIECITHINAEAVEDLVGE